MRKQKREKTGGRKKGTPNKDTKELREKISDLIDNNFDSIQSDMDSLTPEKRLDFLAKLFEYSLPKLNRTELDTGVNLSDMKPFNIRDIYKIEGDEESGHAQKNLIKFED